MQTTRQSGWSLPDVLWLFSGNFMIMRFRRRTLEACHLIFRCYVIDEHCDIICDVMALHVHQSHDLLL